MFSKLFKHWKDYVYATVLLIIGGIGGEALQGIVVKMSLDFRSVAFLIASVLALAGIIILLELSRKIDKLIEQTGAKFTYFSMDDNISRDKLFRESERIIRLAEREILAINSYAEERPNFREKREQRKSYFHALEETSRKVDYIRILQLDTGESIKNRFDTSYQDHFTKIIKERERCINNPKNSRVIELNVVSPKFPSTFVIVDEQYLLWQLNEIDADELERNDLQKPTPKRDRIRMRGVVVVHDTQGQFINDFKTTFWRAYNQKSRSVELSDI